MCIFCKIEEEQVILKTARSIAIVNKYPLGKMSFLCVPKTHVNSLTELSLGEKTDLLLLTVELAERVKAKFAPEGLNIFINEGSIAGQTTEHLHIHIVARSLDDNLKNYERIGEITAITTEEAVKIKEIILKRN